MGTKFETLLDKLVEFPYIRVAIFAFVATFVFFFLGLQGISRLFFLMIPQAIIGRVLSFFLCLAEHPITLLWVAALFIGIELSIAAAALSAFGNAFMIIAGAISAGVGVLAIFIAAIGFLVRLFIALFG